MKQRRARFQWLFSLVVCALLVAGCGGRQQAVLDAPMVAQQAATAMAQVQTLHFVVELSGRLTYVDTTATLGLKFAEGDVATPDRVRAKLRTTTYGVINEWGVVGIGLDQWVTNPLNGRWQRLPPAWGQFNLAALFDPKAGIANLLRTATWTAGDAQTFSLRATLDGSTLQVMTSGMITQGRVDAVLVLDPATQRVVRATLVERDSSADKPTTWQIALSQFDASITIAPPPEG